MKKLFTMTMLLVWGVLSSCKSDPSPVGLIREDSIQSVTLTEDTDTKVNTEVVAQLQQPTEVEILSPIVIDNGVSMSTQTPDIQPKASLPEGTRIKLPAGTPVTLPAGTEVKEYRINWLAWGVYLVSICIMFYMAHHMLKKK